MKSTFVSVLMSLHGAYIDLGIVISEMKYKKTPAQATAHDFLPFYLSNMHIYFPTNEKLFDKFCTKIYYYIIFL